MALALEQARGVIARGEHGPAPTSARVADGSANPNYAMKPAGGSGAKGASGNQGTKPNANIAVSPNAPTGPSVANALTTVMYLHSDHLGSVSVVTDASQNVVSRAEYDPWGKVRGSTGTSPTKQNYTGQKLDSSGLLYYHARYYDPALGRFLSPDSTVPGASSGSGGAASMLGVSQNSKLTVDFHESGYLSTVNGENAFTQQKGFWFQLSDDDRSRASDPSGPDNPQALARYSYVTNNPLRYTDPTGHWMFVRYYDAQGKVYASSFTLSHDETGELASILGGAATVADILAGILAVVVGPGVLIGTLDPLLAGAIEALAEGIWDLAQAAGGIAAFLGLVWFLGGAVGVNCLLFICTPGVMLPFWPGGDPSSIPSNPHYRYVCSNGKEQNGPCPAAGGGGGGGGADGPPPAPVPPTVPCPAVIPGCVPGQYPPGIVPKTQR